MSVIENYSCLLLQLSNGGTAIAKSTAEHVGRFCADLVEGKAFATLIDFDGEASYYNTSLLYAVSPITQTRYDELHEVMEKQNLAVRMNVRVPNGMKRVPGAIS